jgi:hypothetical protein
VLFVVIPAEAGIQKKGGEYMGEKVIIYGKAG